MVVSVTAKHRPRAVIGSPLTKLVGTPFNVFWAVDNPGPVDGFVKALLSNLTSGEARRFSTGIIRVPARGNAPIYFPIVTMPVGDWEMEVIVEEVLETGGIVRTLGSDRFIVVVPRPAGGGPLVAAAAPSMSPTIARDGSRVQIEWLVSNPSGERWGVSLIVIAPPGVPDRDGIPRGSQTLGSQAVDLPPGAGTTLRMAFRVLVNNVGHDAFDLRLGDNSLRVVVVAYPVMFGGSFLVADTTLILKVV